MIRRVKTGGSGRVRVGIGQLGLRVNRVASQNGSFLNELIKLRVNQVAGQVKLTRIFQKSFFFFFK